MSLEEVKATIDGLVSLWIRAGLLNSGLSHGDFANAITMVMLGNRDTERTTYIFNTILNRTIELGQSSEWMHSELIFESIVEHGVDRAEALAVHVEIEGKGNDASLDLYNERLNRFK